MYFVSTNSENFPFKQAEMLYNENKKYFLPLDISFKEHSRRLNGNLWATIADCQFLGLIFFEWKNGKLFLSGCSKRKMFKYVSKAIIGLCELYFEQTNLIYSETEHKWAKQALKRAGFLQISDNLFKKGIK